MSIRSIDRDPGVIMRKPRKESLLNLQIYAEMVNSPDPLTVDQLMERLDVPREYVKPMLQNRARRGVMTCEKTPNGKTYTFTPEGYQYIKEILQLLKVSPAYWARAERKFDPPGRPRPV